MTDILPKHSYVIFPPIPLRPYTLQETSIEKNSLWPQAHCGRTPKGWVCDDLEGRKHNGMAGWEVTQPGKAD